MRLVSGLEHGTNALLGHGTCPAHGCLTLLCALHQGANTGLESGLLGSLLGKARAATDHALCLSKLRAHGLSLGHRLAHHVLSAGQVGTGRFQSQALGGVNVCACPGQEPQAGASDVGEVAKSGSRQSSLVVGLLCGGKLVTSVGTAKDVGRLAHGGGPSPDVGCSLLQIGSK